MLVSHALLVTCLRSLRNSLRSVQTLGSSVNQDTSTSLGRCFLQMFGVFAEFEDDIRAEGNRMEAKWRTRAGGSDV